MKFSIKEALGFGWATVKKHFWPCVGLAAGIFVISALAGGKSGDDFSPFSALMSIVAAIVGTFIKVGVIRLSLKIQKGEIGGANDFKVSWRMFWNFFFGGILYGLIVVGGLILLIVPGIMWAMKYSQHSFLIVDKNMGPIEALKESGKLMEGQKWQFFLFVLSCLGVCLLGLLALGVGLLVAVPVVVIATAYVYRRLEQAEMPIVAAATTGSSV